MWFPNGQILYLYNKGNERMLVHYVFGSQATSLEEGFGEGHDGGG